MPVRGILHSELGGAFHGRTPNQFQWHRCHRITPRADHPRQRLVLLRLAECQDPRLRHDDLALYGRKPDLANGQVGHDGLRDSGLGHVQQVGDEHRELRRTKLLDRVRVVVSDSHKPRDDHHDFAGFHHIQEVLPLQTRVPRTDLARPCVSAGEFCLL